MEGKGIRWATSIRRYRWVLWGVLAVVCLLLAVETRHREQAALDDQVAQAERRAQDHANTALSSLTTQDVSRPMIGATYRDVIVPVQAEAMTDPLVARVRVWSPDGTLLFSTDERETIGRVRSSDDLAISTALQGGTTTRLLTAPYRPATVGAAATDTELLQTFSPLHVSDRVSIQGAVETDQFWQPIRDAAVSPWRLGQGVLVALAAVCAAVGIMLFRRRVRAAAMAALEPLTDEPTVAAPAQTETTGAVAGSASNQGASEPQGPRELERDASLAALEERVGVAERRAQEAERRLQKLADDVAAAPGRSEVPNPAPVDPETVPPLDEPSDGSRQDKQAAALRARLARTAARKKPGGVRDED